jgi:hypothetical protein
MLLIDNNLNCIDCKTQKVINIFLILNRTHVFKKEVGHYFKCPQQLVAYVIAYTKTTNRFVLNLLVG